MKIIITGVTGMVGEGILLASLQNPEVTEILSVSRKSCEISHPKLKEFLIPEFSKIADHPEKVSGYDACFYCAGISSVGMEEEEFSKFTYFGTTDFAKVLADANPNMVFYYVSGRGTDSTEKGKTMWARVKGKTENALLKMPFRKVYCLRPALMKPMPGQKHFKGYNKSIKITYPLLSLFFPTISLKEMATAMINGVKKDFPKTHLETKDMKELSRF